MRPHLSLTRILWRCYLYYIHSLREPRFREIVRVLSSIPNCRTSKTPAFHRIVPLHTPPWLWEPHLSLLPTGTAGIYQGANGLSSAAGFGTMHQVTSSLPGAFWDFPWTVPWKSGHREAACTLVSYSLGSETTGTRLSQQPLERYSIEAEKSELLADFQDEWALFYVPSWSLSKTPSDCWIWNVWKQKRVPFTRPLALQGWKDIIFTCASHCKVPSAKWGHYKYLWNGT